jgi:hypothetical protein
MFKKILLVGGSIFNPSYFNSRIFNDDKTLDDFSFNDIVKQVSGVEVSHLAINGAGNDWAVNAILSNSSLIDKDTLVVVQWAAIDRHELHLDNDIPNERISFPKKELLPSHVRYEQSFFNTYNLKGQKDDTGLRFYSTGPAWPGIKKEYFRLFFNKAYHLKKFYENVILVQNFLEKNCYKQIHILPFNIHHYLEVDILSPNGYFSKINNTNKYVWAEWPEKSFDLINEYPELENWRNEINWSLFTENYIDFFYKNQLPYWSGINEHNIHQVPINNYKFICSEIIKDTIDRTDFYLNATLVHCKKFNVEYPINPS